MLLENNAMPHLMRKIEVNEGINFINKTAFSIWLIGMYSMKMTIQIMMGDIVEAENTLQYANEIKSEIYPPPFLLIHFLQSHFIIDLFQLEQSIKAGNASEVSKK